MARKKTPPKDVAGRVTLINVKGDEAEKEFLRCLVERTGVSLSEITRRSIVLWASKRGVTDFPPGWVRENGSK